MGIFDNLTSKFYKYMFGFIPVALGPNRHLFMEHKHVQMFYKFNGRLFHPKVVKKNKHTSFKFEF